MCFVPGGTSQAGPIPHGLGEHQEKDQADLDVGHRPETTSPAGGPGQVRAHDDRADGGAQAPHAVQPVHVDGAVMPGDEAIDGGVHHAAGQPQGNHQQAQQPVAAGEGNAKDADDGNDKSACHHALGAKPADQPAAEQACDDRSQDHHHVGRAQGLLHLAKA